MNHIASSTWFQSMRKTQMAEQERQARAASAGQLPFGTEYVLRDGKLQERAILPAYLTEVFKPKDAQSVVLQRSVLVLLLVLFTIYIINKA